MNHRRPFVDSVSSRPASAWQRSGNIALLASVMTLIAVIPLSHADRIAAQQLSADISADDVSRMRGDALYQQMCAACHGLGGEGGPGGAANLTRSAIATAADNGETLGAFLAVGRPDKGMPPFPLSNEQYADLSRATQAFAAAGANAPNRTTEEVVLVGDAEAGRAYFEGSIGQCSSCHSVSDGEASTAANLAHVGSRFDDPKSLQNAMVLNRSFFWSPATSDDVTATVTYGDGRVLTGLLTSISDFKVVIRDADGRTTMIERFDGQPAVELEDRLQHHIDMLDVYQDSDIHDLTAYLWTLK